MALGELAFPFLRRFFRPNLDITAARITSPIFTASSMRGLGRPATRKRATVGRSDIVWFVLTRPTERDTTPGLASGLRA